MLSGNTALHLAVMGDYQVKPLRVKLLLQSHGSKRPNVNLRNFQGKTALDIALERGHQGLARIIIRSHPCWHVDDDSNLSQLTQEVCQAVGRRDQSEHQAALRYGHCQVIK